MLKVVGQDIISGAMGFVGTEPGWLYQMGSLNGVAKASGNLLTLKQCKNKPLKGLTIYGKSEQLTFTGANLFNVSSKQSGFVSGIEIGDKVEVSQNASYPKAVYFDEITVDSTKNILFAFGTEAQCYQMIMSEYVFTMIIMWLRKSLQRITL